MINFTKKNVESAIKDANQIYINEQPYYKIYHKNGMETHYLVNIIWEMYQGRIMSLRNYDGETKRLYITTRSY